MVGFPDASNGVDHQTAEARDAMLCLALTAAHMGTWDFDMAAGVGYVSPEYVDLFGFVPGTTCITWDEWAERVHPEDLPRVQACFDAAAAGQKPYAAEYRILRVDGTTRWVAANAAILRDVDGKPLRAVGVIRDITERKRTEDALRRGEARYRLLAEASSSIIWSTMADGSLAEPQSSWEAFTGQRWPEYQGDGWLAALHPDDRERMAPAWRQAIATGTPMRTEYRLRRHDGEWRLMEIVATPVPGDGNSVLEWIGTCTDVTERRETESTLLRQKGQLAAAMQAGRLGTWESDLQTGLIEATPSCKANLGLPPDYPLTRQTLLNIIHPDDRDRVAAAIGAAVAEGKDYDVEYRAVHPDGSIHWVNSRGTLLREGGTPRRLVGVTIDITARKRIENERERALEERSQALKELNHRVKNNMQMIASLLRLQAARIDDPHAREQFGRACQRVAAIADIHTRLYQNDQVHSLDFGQYLRELCTHLSTMLLPRGSNVEIRVEAQDAEIDVDRAIPLGLVVNELVTNAAKYGFPGAGGVITVAFARNPSGFRLSVGDTGRGLPVDKRELPKGLGLKLVDLLVKQVGGNLSIKHQSGIIFDIEIPA